MVAKELLVAFLSIASPDLPSDVDLDSAYCLAENIYHEASGESLEGKAAVASVTLNRVNDSRFPDTVCGVTKYATAFRDTGGRIPEMYKCAYSWYCDGKSDTVPLVVGGKVNPFNVDAFHDSVSIAVLALGGVIADNTNGATHYYNPRIVRQKPTWADIYPPVAEVGNHVFHLRPTGSLL